MHRLLILRTTAAMVVIWSTLVSVLKTGSAVCFVLLPPAIDVLERNGWKVPQIDNTKYNYTLKTLGAALGIENMHSHLARHTFATYMLEQRCKGAEPYAYARP